MPKVYNFDIIPTILENFKIKNVIISGVKDETLMENILSYDADYTLLNTVEVKKLDVITGNPLDVLNDLSNYDAIFIDDDSNWYTVFTQLNIIKNSNEEFPLVFICNDKFPNKRRDSYSNPDEVPDEFRNEYMKELPICYNNEKITIFDGFYHACEENTPQNGVLTAIEDFLGENSHVGIMKINFIDDITILYNKLPINNKRIDIVHNAIGGLELNDLDVSSKLIENKLLVSYINKYNVFNEKLGDYELEISNKTGLINDYEEKMRIQDNEIHYKDSQIDSFESKLNLKDTQIKSFESKLNISDLKIKNFESELVDKNKTIDQLQKELNNMGELKKELKDSNDNIDKLKNFESELVDKNKTIDQLQKELNNMGELKKELKDSNDNIDKLQNELKDNNNKINEMLSDFNKKEGDFAKEKLEWNNQINSLKDDFSKKEQEHKNQLSKVNSQIDEKEKVIQQQKNQLEIINQKNTYQLSKSSLDKYCISCFKEEVSNNHAEIKYLKNNTFTRKILSPLGYLYLILKSKPREIPLNINLFKALKDSKCFDIGFYLNNNPDIQKSKWCKYFSPELHYVCNGFNEERTFNKKYFNRNSKKDLLDYIRTCDK